VNGTRIEAGGNENELMGSPFNKSSELRRFIVMRELDRDSGRCGTFCIERGREV
jgi:hypothetical protein